MKIHSTLLFTALACVVIGVLLSDSLAAQLIKKKDEPENGEVVRGEQEGTDDKKKADAQSNDEQASQPKLGPQYTGGVKARWHIGTKIRGKGAPQSLFVTLPLPNDWPEQRVTLIEEELPDHTVARVGYRNLDSNVRQMLVTLPRVAAGQLISISVKVEVETMEIVEPSDKSVYVIPKSSLDGAKSNLVASDHVNFKNGSLRKFVKELIAEAPSDWKKVEVIYDWVRDEIESADGDTTNALNAFRKRTGCNEDRIFLFVAMCRIADIPARIVFANEFNYAEFMLTDKDGKQAYWFPANINGVYELGSLAEPKIILQKGDGIRVPEKAERQKYVAEFAAVKSAKPPAVAFFREQLDDESDQ